MQLNFDLSRKMLQRQHIAREWPRRTSEWSQTGTGVMNITSGLPAAIAALLIGLGSAPADGQSEYSVGGSRHAVSDHGGKPAFRVIAFFTARQDDAHISFVREAVRWFPKVAAKYNFGFDTTSAWNNLNQ